MNRQERRAVLQRLLQEDPFLTDSQLAEALKVSIATIRLDRMALDIPELRVRARTIASSTYSQVRAMQGKEVVGDLVKLNLGQSGTSVLEVAEHMVFERSRILRGHFLFAQGNSLAVALVNSEFALTKSANIRFYRPVKQGDRVAARAVITSVQGNRYAVSVDSRVDDEIVFRGEYVVVDVAEKGGAERG